jgi:SAM-dependent methyltransferase
MSELYTSAEQMQGAVNYNQWTYEQFAPYLHGDVLEVGCGVGSFTKIITEKATFNSLYSIDISEPAISFIKTKTFKKPVRFECIDLVHVTGSYDFIVCMNVMEHVEDDKRFFKHLISLLKPNGVLFLLVPSHQSLYSDFDKAAGHYKRYAKKDLDTLPKEYSKLLKRYYFNPIGALGYWFVYKVLKKNPQEKPGEIDTFDKYVVPMSKMVFPQSAPFGISLIAVFQKATA